MHGNMHVSVNNAALVPGDLSTCTLMIFCVPYKEECMGTIGSELLVFRTY